MKFQAYAVLPSLILMMVCSNAFANPTSIATQLLTSGQIDLAADTVTVPLHHGKLKDGRGLWYVLIDASDEATAKQLGLVYAPALAEATNGIGTRAATLGADGEWVFDHGSVDFSTNRQVVPGDAPNLFPPKEAKPGSAGSADYSPYVLFGNVIYNAPIIAFDVTADEIVACDPGSAVDHSKVHDKVVRICPKTSNVTLALSHGFASGKSLIYVSLDSNDPVASAMEGATYAPALNDLKGTGATLPLFAVTNGEVGKGNPSRQGLDSALNGDGSPLNVLTGIPTLSSAPYSPLWDLHLTQWTSQAISSGQRRVLTSSQDFRDELNSGLLTTFGVGAVLLVNCPAVAILDSDSLN